MNKTVVISNALLVIAMGLIASFVVFWPSDEPAEAIVSTPPNEERILELINNERASRGISPLKKDPYVQLSASLKANHMEEHNYFSHNLPGTNYTDTPEMASASDKVCMEGTASENIIEVYDDSTSESTVESWMSSKPHREAILNPEYDITGLALSSGKVNSVQHFCISK